MKLPKNFFLPTWVIKNIHVEIEFSTWMFL